MLQLLSTSGKTALMQTQKRERNVELLIPGCSDGKVMPHVYLDQLLAASVRDGASLRTADEAAGCEACCFWQTEYTQSSYSAVFYSVTQQLSELEGERT